MLPQIADYPIVHLERLSGRRFYDKLNSISIYPKNHSMSIDVIYMDDNVHSCTIKPHRTAESDNLK